MPRKYTADELSVVESHYRTHSHSEIAKMVGRSVSSIRNLCSARGWTTRNDHWSDEHLALLIAWYTRPGGGGRDTIRIEDIAKSIGRTKVAVCIKARALGLTRRSRPLLLDKSKQKLSVASKKRIAEKGHPRGALGMKHSPETLAIISKKSKSQWDFIKGRPILMHGRRAKTVRTNIERYGTACPVQAINKGQNVYSRCRRGVREDLGIFVRSRWEANYARYLKWLQERGDIAAWEYEPTTFRFDGVSRGPYTYKPDFKVIEKDGVVAIHEVKGWMDSASRGKLKRFAKFYPTYKLVVIDQAAYRQIERAVSAVIPHWEGEK